MGIPETGIAQVKAIVRKLKQPDGWTSVMQIGKELKRDTYQSWGYLKCGDVFKENAAIFETYLLCLDDQPRDGKPARTALYVKVKGDDSEKTPKQERLATQATERCEPKAQKLRLLGYYHFPNQTMKPETEYVNEAHELSLRLASSMDNLKDNPETDNVMRKMIVSNTVFIFRDENHHLYGYFTGDKSVRISNVIYNRSAITEISRKYKAWFCPGKAIRLVTPDEDGLHMTETPNIHNMEEKVEDIIALNHYRQTADKIVQLLAQIRENPSLSAKRWVWELMQNAKDVPNSYERVSVEIELCENDQLLFRHNGDPFTMMNITCLVQQVSSKDSQNQEGQTGKFGTGFICTHLLSDIIDVSGVLYYLGKYRRFCVKLNRSGERSEEMIPRIQSTLEELRKAESTFPEEAGYKALRKETSLDTVFTYHLTTPEKREAAKAGLADLINTLPVTLISQSRIKQVRVINRLDGTDVTYQCQTSVMDDNVRKSTVTIDGNTKQYLTYTTDKVALTIEFEESADGSYKLIKRDSQQPVLYRDFPLIGSEKFYFPYTLNGFHFHPTERRNGILLNTADSQSACENRTIIDHAVEASLLFNQWLISHNVSCRHLVAQSRMPESTEKYDEYVAKPWIDQLQKKWRASLLRQELVETSQAPVAIAKATVPYCQFTSAEQDDFFRLVAESALVSERVLPRMEHLHDWLDILSHENSSWGDAALRYTIEDLLSALQKQATLATLAATMRRDASDALNWLNKLYKFIIDKKQTELLSKYAVVPNQLGQLKKLEELKSDAKGRIPQELKEIYDSIEGASAIEGVLLDETVDVALFAGLVKAYTMDDAAAFLDGCAKQKVEVVYQLLALCPDTDNEYNQTRQRMYEFCSDCHQMQPMRYIKTDKHNLWTAADAFWYSQSIEDIASHSNIKNLGEEFFVNTKSEDQTLAWLDSLFAFFREQSKGDTLKDKKIFPNQQGNLCELNSLRFDDNIDEAFKDVSENIDKNGWRPLLLSRAISGYNTHRPAKTKDLYDGIKDRFDTLTTLATERAQIAAQVVAILPADSDDKSYAQMWQFARDIFGDAIPDCKSISNYEGFKWDFVHKYYINQIAETVAKAVNLSGLRALAPAFKEMSDKELTVWVDSFIDFVYSYKQKRHWDVITDREHGRGVWLNQKGDFCKYGEVREDGGIPEKVKDVALNKHVGIDFRTQLFTCASSCAHYLGHISGKVEMTEVGAEIDEKVSSYDGNKQDKDFAKLVFDLCNLCKSISGFEKCLRKFTANKPKLIVGSLGEGETMDLVANIVQADKNKQHLIRALLNGELVADDNGRVVTVGGLAVDGLSTKERTEVNEEARRMVQERLEEEGYEFTQGIGMQSVVDGVMKDGVDYPLVVKSYRSGGLFKLNPNEWLALQRAHAMLWVRFAGRLEAVNIGELLRKQDELTFSFSTSNLESDERVLTLAENLRFFKQMHFDLTSLDPALVSDKKGDYSFNNKTDNPISEHPCNDSNCNL